MATTNIFGALRPDGDRVCVRLEREYPTDVGDLWSAVTERDRLAGWFAPVEGELRPGGDFLIVFDPDDPAQRTAGTVLKCVPPEHLAISWRLEGQPDSRVTVDVRPADGASLLVVEHARLPVAGAPGYAAGWQTFLEQLDADVRGEPSHDQSWDERWERLLPVYQAQLQG